MASYEVKEHKLHVPSLEEVAKLFEQNLKDHFKEVEVTVQECPDLKSAPFHLTQTGLNGNPCIADVGGVPNLVPMAKVEKDSYSVPEILKQIGFKTGSAIGAAGGPHQLFGMNCEGMPNVSVNCGHGDDVHNETYVAKLEPSEEKGYKLIKLTGHDEARFCLLGNLFICKGSPGKVIKIRTKVRTSDQNNFIGILRKILDSNYSANGQTVSMGGVFVIKSGKAKLHIMPDFSNTPLTSDDDVNNWLKYFEMSAPLVCMTTFHSSDPGLDLRIEHTHCFSDHGDGGHYHYDVTPDIVEYEGYFNIAEKIYRVDAPKETHNIGRD